MSTAEEVRVMIEQSDSSAAPTTSREQDLELEVARLSAELATLRGEDPALATSRFLAMAAATAEQAVEDARREADEVTSLAATRRDEATRLANEAEAETDRLRAEAARSEEVIENAKTEAESIRTEAVEEARRLGAVERDRVAGEIDALIEVRTAFESERAALESYHEELSRRVQDLAESMVAFMSTEPPLTSGHAIGAAAALSLDEAPEAGTEATGDEAGADSPFAAALAAAIGVEPDGAEDAGAESGDVPVEFGGVLVEDQPDEEGAADAAPTPVDQHEPGGDEEHASGLFASHGERLVEQISRDELVEALESDSWATDDEFEEFLSGDEEQDPSRDWLLRPD